MPTAYVIPLKAQAQRLRISLGGSYYRLTILWNNFSSNWNIDIADDSLNPILFGIPLVVGVNLLQQFGYMNFGGALVVSYNNTPNLQPTYSDIGVNSKLYFVVP